MIWSVNSGVRVQELTVPDVHYCLRRSLLLFSPHGALLMVGSGKGLHVWRTKDWIHEGTLDTCSVLSAVCVA